MRNHFYVDLRAEHRAQDVSQFIAVAIVVFGMAVLSAFCVVTRWGDVVRIFSGGPV